MTGFDVVFVGGGLGGSSLAGALCSAGRRVLVLERSEAFEDRVRGEWLAPWGVAEARRLEIYDDLIAAGGHTLKRNIGFDELFASDAVAASPLPLGDLHPDSEGPLCLEHVVMQNTLLERACKLGADVRRGIKAVEIVTGEQPRVRYQHAGTSHEAECRLIVGADGRSSTVRRQADIALHENPVDHLIAGLLVEGAHDWPEDLQSLGKVADRYYLIFPQGGGKVRLYADYAVEDRGRFSGAEGSARFLAGFAMDCVPHSDCLANATPIGPCMSYPSQDAWTDRPYAEGVVLVGDAAGYNDPIVGQGQSITLRDVRIVSELLASKEAWTPDLFEPYAAERAERLRRLRFCASLVTELNARFDPDADARRRRAFKRMGRDPRFVAPVLALMSGPETISADLFDPALLEELLAPD
jgi:2-polyprenyl-6-methoxyphenol hydroxylase-like FAD-dependent oxidoreductase